MDRDDEIMPGETSKDDEAISQNTAIDTVQHLTDDGEGGTQILANDDKPASQKMVDKDKVSSQNMDKDDTGVHQTVTRDDESITQADEGKFSSQDIAAEDTGVPQTVTKDDKSVTDEVVAEEKTLSQEMDKEHNVMDQTLVSVDDFVLPESLNETYKTPEIAGDTESVLPQMAETDKVAEHIAYKDEGVSHEVLSTTKTDMQSTNNVDDLRINKDSETALGDNLPLAPIQSTGITEPQVTSLDGTPFTKTESLDRNLFSPTREMTSVTKVQHTNVANYIDFIIDSAVASTQSSKDFLLKKEKFKTKEVATDDSLSRIENSTDSGDETQTDEATRTVANAQQRKLKKRKKDHGEKKKPTSLPPLTPHRPAKFEANSTRSDYISYPPLSQLPYYPKLAFPRKWGVSLTHAEPRTVLVGFTCPPAPKFRQDQLMTHSASTLRRYYSKPCIKTIEWIKVSAKR